MSSFKTKYPAFSALLKVAAVLAQDLAIQGQSVAQKIGSAMNVISPLMTLIPQSGSLGSELSQLKASPLDIEAAAEELVTDLAFSSDKAKAIIAAAFPLAESLVGIVPQAEALTAAIRA